MVDTLSSLTEAIDSQGFAFVHADVMRNALAACGRLSDWEAFSESWNALELDTYMAEGARYRSRRHGTFSAEPGGPIERETHQPHYQSLQYNPLHGGVERWFEPIAEGIGAGATMRTILAFCRSLFEPLAKGPRRWHIEVHQFRIEARPGEAGLPTPEGLHRDGVEYVLVLLVHRQNIASGITSIHALDGRRLGHFTLTYPFDAAIVDDTRVAHGVTPVQAIRSRPSVPTATYWL